MEDEDLKAPTREAVEFARTQLSFQLVQQLKR